MDALFRDILKDNSDPRSLINQSLPAIMDWAEPLISFKETGYNRNSVCKIDDYNEVVLACWKKNQITPFHLHPGQSCWIYMMSGALEETRVLSQINFALKEGLFDWSDLESQYNEHTQWPEFQNNKAVSLATAGTWHYIDDNLGFHRMCAHTDEVVSLHFYRQLGL
jgi:hypothetical protein